MDLLIKQVTEGLSPAEQRALDVLDSEVASVYARDFERAAAADCRGRKRCRGAAAGGIAGSHRGASARVFRRQRSARRWRKRGDGRRVQGVAGQDAVAERRARGARRAPLGWWAAAACLVLAVFGWLRAPHPLSGAAATPAEERAALLARPDSVEIPLSATKDPAAAGVTGDVVWNPATQRGFLRFVGLRPNDPACSSTRCGFSTARATSAIRWTGGCSMYPRTPREVLVPIRAAVPVHAAKAFAVTIEKPGGVVVSGARSCRRIGTGS